MTQNIVHQQHVLSVYVFLWSLEEVKFRFCQNPVKSNLTCDQGSQISLLPFCQNPHHVKFDFWLELNQELKFDFCQNTLILKFNTNNNIISKRAHTVTVCVHVYREMVRLSFHMELEIHHAVMAVPSSQLSYSGDAFSWLSDSVWA